MNLLEYPNLTPVALDDYRQSKGITWLHATAVIVTVSLSLWGLILYAVWQLI